MPTGNGAALKALAEATAATVQATVRHWWLDPANPRLLHIAAERTFVGARPLIVHFTVRLQPTQTVAAAGPARMQVGVSIEPPPAVMSNTPTQSIIQPPVRKAKRRTLTKVVTQPTGRRKPRTRVGSPTRTTRPKKRTQPPAKRAKRQISSSRAPRRKARRTS
jgi:hypothetical protein